MLEDGKAWLRVVDPGANVSPDRDRVTVDLNATISEDMATTDLVETGAATGIFEGEVALTTDWVADYQQDPEHLLTWPQTNPPASLDTAHASYGGASASAEAAPSLLDFLDDGGRSAASFAVGERVRVRVRDLYADRHPGPNTTVAVLTSSGGDSETLTLLETGDRTGVFEVSLPLVAETPAANDGRLQAAAGATLSVTHADENGFSSSSDGAGVTATSVRFIDWRDGSLPALYVENGYVAVRVVDTAANLDPGSFDTANVILYRSVDQEPLTLQETGADTGVFEGRMRLRVDTFGYGNGYLEPNYLTDPPVTSTVGVAYQGGPIVTAKVVQSILSLRDGQGAAATSIAPGQTLHLRVEAARGLESTELERVRVRVQSLTSGDEETLYLLETGSYSWLFEGTLQPVAGAAIPNDGQVQALPGEVLQVDHFDVYNVLRASDQVSVVRSAVRFVDADGRTVSTLLEGDTARVEVLDLLSAGQAPPFALIGSYLAWDDEDLALVESATPGLFEDEMALTTDWSPDGDGLLYTSYGTTPRYHYDRVTAQANGASAVAGTAPALLEILDEQGEPRTTATGGVSLWLRVTSPRMNKLAGQAETLLGMATSEKHGDMEYVYLAETGPDTAVFEATLPTAISQSWPQGDGVLTVLPEDTVTVLHDPPNAWYESEHDRTVASLSFVPVLVELVDGQGGGVSTYLLTEPVHLRVTESAANTSPSSAESISVQVQARRPGDSGTDLETVSLTETGPDTGVFTGTLPSSVLSYPTPQLGNGLLEVMAPHPVYRDDTTVTAFRGDATDTAVFKDSELWLTNDAGQETESFPLGLPIRIWLRRPVANTTPGIEIEGVSIRVRTGGEDQEWLTLEETGGGTGLFTDLLPTGDGTVNAWNNTLEGSSGDLVEVVRTSGYIVGSYDRGILTATAPNSPPDAVDDSATTPEDTPVSIAVLGNDSDLDDDTLTVTAVTQGTKGSVAIDGGSTVTYTPNADANGGDSFTYTVDDGNGGTDTATVTVTITPVPDPVVAVDDTATTSENVAVVLPVLANDLNPDGGTLSVSQVAGVSGGTTVINADNTVTFTPWPGWDGAAALTYQVTSSLGGSDSAAVAITVTGQNDPPVPGNDTATTNEETTVEISLLDNDTDPELQTLTVTAVTQAADGLVTLLPGGARATYLPAAGFNGTDTFTYTVSDPVGASSVGTVTVTVAPVNDQPLAADDSATTLEDTAVSIAVLGNDDDMDGDTLTVTAVTQGAKGSVAIDGGSTVTYTPNADANGGDSFTYTVSDGNGGTDTATVTVSITPVPDPVVAVDDTATTAENVAVVLPVLGNDRNPDGGTLTVSQATGIYGGDATINADNTITFTPSPGFDGPAVVSYTVVSSLGGYDIGEVAVTVTGQNDPPVVGNDGGSNGEDTPIVVSVLDNDADPELQALTVTAVTQGTNGSVAITGGGTQVTYTPAANFHGTDSFTYTVTDAPGLASTGTVAVTVTSLNDPPVALDDAATTPEDTSVTLAVLGNDTDVDSGDVLTVDSVTQSPGGTVTTNGATVTFTPAANLSGLYSFTYTVRDSAGSLDTASVAVTVTAVNDAPVAQPDAASTNEDTAMVISVLANDSDVDGNPLTVTAVTQGTLGAVTANGTSVTYTPAANLFGADSFSYTVGDGQGGTATATVSVSVAAVNDPPAAGADSGATRERVAIIIPVLANDTDLEANPLTVTAVGDPHNGTTLRLADNTVRYTPDMNFTGSETFTYTVSDGQGGTGTGQVTVTVGEALEQVALLATNSVALRIGSDVISGDVIVNQGGAGPFLNGASISVGQSVTTPSFYDLEGNSITVASTATVYSHVWYNQLTNNGIISAVLTTPLALPVFSALPPFLTATPGSTNVNVSSNGSRTLAAGSYQDLSVGRKGTVTFSGGVYHFRTMQLDREAKLYFAAPTEIRVQQKLTSKELAVIGPAAGAAIDASSIVFHVAGINGTSGSLTATPKVVEVGVASSLQVNIYAPNGTIWLQDRTQATGAFLGKDIDVGADVQVSLDSAFAGGQ